MPTRLPPLRRLAVALFAAAAFAAAADAPTKEEWAPVAQAIAQEAATARPQIEALLRRYPGWADGWIEYARFELHAQRFAEAERHARKAHDLAKPHGEAAALLVQALSAQGRHDDALSAAEFYRENRSHDRQPGNRAGWVSFYAAQAALLSVPAGATREQAQPVIARADEFLKAAKASAAAGTPAEFHVLDARLAVRKGDLAGAEKSLERATAIDAKQWDAWYELGRVRSVLAEQAGNVVDRRTRLEAAETAFTTVVRALPDDWESWYGLGRAQAARGRLAAMEGGDGVVALRDAVASLDEALKRKADHPEAWAALGEAQLRLDRFAEAVTSLEKARTLGAGDKALLFNLAMALEKAGRAEDATRILSQTTASTSAELVNKGMGSYRAKLYPAAIELLTQATRHPDLAGNDLQRAKIERWIGHIQRDWATAEVPRPATAEERAARLAAAAEAYRRAGDLGDAVARRHFAAIESERSPADAYRAGWIVLRWNAFFSFSGLAMVAGNYGAARAWDNTLHLAVWGVLGGIPLLLWVAGLLRRKPVPADEARRASTRAAKAPTARREERRPPAPSTRPPSAPTTRPPSPPTTQPGSGPLARRPAPSAALEPRQQPKAPPAARHVDPPAKRTAPPPGRTRSPMPETEEIERPAGAPPPPAKRPR